MGVLWVQFGCQTVEIRLKMAAAMPGDMIANTMLGSSKRFGGAAGGEWGLGRGEISAEYDVIELFL